MLTYTGTSLTECYWEAYLLMKAVEQELPPELIAKPPQWPERFNYNIQLDPAGELERVKLSLKENMP